MTKNEPYFAGDVKAPLHAGIGHQYLMPIDLTAVDWAKVISAIKELIPNESVSVEQHIKSLQQIGQCQKKVSELKYVHNLLHLLETALNLFELQIRDNMKQGKILDLNSVEENWRRSVLPPIRYLKHFASQDMKFLKPACILAEDQRQGPTWILDILQHQSDFETSLRDSSGDEEIHKHSQRILENCRDHMFYIDKELKDEIDLLAQISYPILRSIGDGSANT